MTVRPSLGRWLIVAPLVAALLLVAGCDGGGASTPEPTVTPTAAPTLAPSGSPVAADAIIDLAEDEPATLIWGADEGDVRSDSPALATGDLNGDGLDDLVIGARFGDGPNNDREEAGEAYVIFGSAGLASEIDLATAPLDMTIYGAAAGDNLGFSAVISDVNADGRVDLILGAPFARDRIGLSVGAVYVFFGRQGLGGTLDMSAVQADVTLVGPEATSFFGDSLASADVNDDGVSDIIIGATFAQHEADPDGERLQVGAVFVVFGSSDIAGTLEMAAGEFDAAVYGAEEFDEVGDAVAAGDINGDGIADIVMTAEAADGPDNARSAAAEVYVLFGSANLEGTVLELAQDEPDVTLLGAEQNDTLGFNLTIGELTGDDIADLVVVARQGDGPANAVGEAGEAHIFPGREDWPEVIDLASDGGEMYLYGNDGADLIGAGLGTADLDGDGVAELLIGASFADGPGNTRADGGETYAIDVRRLDTPTILESTNPKLLVYGANPSDRLGSAVTVGDLDGDGALKLVVMAMDAAGPDESRPGTGRIYILTPP